MCNIQLSDSYGLAVMIYNMMFNAYPFSMDSQKKFEEKYPVINPNLDEN